MGTADRDRSGSSGVKAKGNCTKYMARASYVWFRTKENQTFQYNAPMPLGEQANDFLKYAFAETKDLAKYFLTIVTGVLVFSLTFSEKVANFSAARPVVRWSFVAAWCCMFVAIVTAGVALCYVALSGAPSITETQSHPSRPIRSRASQQL
jgi:hypothetical protein